MRKRKFVFTDGKDYGPRDPLFYKKLDYEKSLKWCKKCNDEIPLKNFYPKYVGPGDGFQFHCVTHRKEYYKEWEKDKHYPVSVEKKTCTRCHQRFDSDNFYLARRSKDGLHSWCKQCVIGAVIECNRK
jgi:hypothetical protein